MNTPPADTEISPKTIAPQYRVLAWLVTFLVPVGLTLTVVRIMLTPLYVQIEYKFPGFPVDSYGFTDEERYTYAQNARQYLVNAADISFLGDLRFQNGQPLYNEGELSHMVDVKNVVKAVLNVWYLSLALLVGLGVWAWFGHWRKEYINAIGRGGWLTVLLLGTLLVLVTISFGFVFVAFHNIFFQPGSWTFQYSDTLIRLFPERFWRDLFIAVGGLSILSGAAIGFLFSRARK